MKSLGHLPREGLLSPGRHSPGPRATVSSSVGGKPQAQIVHGTLPGISEHTGGRRLPAQRDASLKVI